MVHTRESLLAAAQRQLNADPLSSMAVVAAAAGAGRATLHRHFASREALLLEIGERSLGRWEQRLDEHAVEEVAASGDPGRIRECIRGLVRSFVDDSDDFGFALTDHFIVTDPVLVARGDTLVEREVTLWEAAQAAGVLRPDLAPRWISHAMYGLLVSAREALRAGDVARRDVGDLVVSTLLVGAGAR
ncbi:TetR/AcrR family transcriptional regulator [Nocardioides sp. SYSU D00038]|uniref:TetR/AcrR family transcriptional regulator n=1 Tax=Nocardioides sp. SYSU D00038 TaxID=2812554 RepID=UPI0019687564|nr:TetR/AcrR family transcriptional regulator [Nocardioides sp. SYSU D00038]